MKPEEFNESKDIYERARALVNESKSLNVPVIFVVANRHLGLALEEIKRLQGENALLKAELTETYTDENGTVWIRPTAWSYSQVCKAKDRLRRKLDELIREEDSYV